MNKWGVIIVLCLLVCCFYAGRITCKPDVIIATDTIVCIDTVRDTILEPQRIYITRIDTCYLPGETDTVQVFVPIERKEYKTDDYHAIIEGYNPRLVSMEVFQKTQTITKIQTVTEKSRLGIGLQAGIGVSKYGAAPYIGVGIQYNLFSW